MSEAESPLPVEIDCETVHRETAAEDAPLLLDCREPDEWAIVRLDGAVLIPMGELPDRLGEIDDRRDQRIVVYCHHGGRSLRVASWLRANGFPHAQSLAGGVDAWAQVIDRSLPRY